MNINKIIELDKRTGCGVYLARKALEYSILHDHCTPLGYIEAMKTNKYKELNFDERVRKLSEV